MIVCVVFGSTSKLPDKSGPSGNVLPLTLILYDKSVSMKRVIPPDVPAKPCGPTPPVGPVLPVAPVCAGSPFIPAIPVGPVKSIILLCSLYLSI